METGTASSPSVHQQNDPLWLAQLRDLSRAHEVDFADARRVAARKRQEKPEKIREMHDLPPIHAHFAGVPLIEAVNSSSA
jgi:hypothetical protein